ncbi:MAG: DUF4249 family protein [Gracilimonas sp.]|nr:DUF4249 family protein [Gracilimonas sp.]
MICKKPTSLFYNMVKIPELLMNLTVRERMLPVMAIGLLCLFLHSCTAENLPISVKPAEPKIAVASVVGPSETLFITLSNSFSALSAEDANDLSQDAIDRLLIDNALVILEYEGFRDTLSSFFDVSGLYGTSLQSFNDYQPLKLTVFDSTSSETITSETKLMPQAQVDSIQITRRDTSVSFLTDFSYQIKDPDEDNFYVVHAYQLTAPDTSEADSVNNDLFFSDQGFLIYEQLVTDRAAENGIIANNDVFEFSSPVDSAIVVITHVSEGYYRFLEARQRSGGIISSLANEPVNHPTNIENGVGYFSAHKPTVRLVGVD